MKHRYRCVILCVLLPAVVFGGQFHYSLEQFALISGYEGCVRQLGSSLSAGQRDALADSLLRRRGLSYQPRRVENDRRLWAYPEYDNQRRLLGYMAEAYRLECLEQNQGRY
ncbi:hypothetical protein Q670_00845 [Alcanivorax sp. P2S70]|uniref:Uncharacterized protein n=1 Tax=Alcanivorax profundi TaxID=2338368 RepID=A0A418XUQ1_9GAMM|nr:MULTISPECIES: hypothetical protein [Alcanivorax]ERP91736.1 hypothetical protein Q670_00845 [Alcanivorax sp. P2S70]RJG16433.1 hypothetical protein D4A39_14340 [Alcanivorax profundi]